jgi:hypothetical protein
MIIEGQQDVTVAAEAVMAQTSDPRLREIMLVTGGTCTDLSVTCA